MIKTILIIAVLSVTSITQAEYFIKVPLEQSQGGPLPKGSIKIGNSTPGVSNENWQPAEAIYSEWINKGDTYGCSWLPATSTVWKGEQFNQSAIDCKQDQIVMLQNREQETTTLDYRNVGLPEIYNNKTIIKNSDKTTVGTAPCFYSNETPETFWIYDPVNFGSYIYVKGKLFHHLSDSTTMFSMDGTIYYMGVLKFVKTADNIPSRYEICKA